MLEAHAGSFLSGGGMLREGLLQMAEEIVPLSGMELLSSKNKLVNFNIGNKVISITTVSVKDHD